MTDFERVKGALDIVEVIGKFFTLVRAGINYKTVCPFHNDSHPSLSISPSKQIYKCFVCGSGGDVITFIQNYLNLSKAEALEWCAKEAGIQLENHELSSAEKERAKNIQSLRSCNDFAARFFENNLTGAAPFLKARGWDIDDEILKEYHVGYAPEGNSFLKKAKASQYNPELMTGADLLKLKDHGSYYDTFRDRVMFPYYDFLGNVTGFTGRIVKSKENGMKYLNTGITPLFIKGRNLYGLYQAKQAISKHHNVFIVEGQFDVLSMVRAGVKNVIAGSGTAFTDDQIKLIHRLTDNVVLMYDDDEAGIKASLKNCEQLLAAGITVKCISIPDGKDPDELARELGDGLPIWLNNHSLNFVSYFYNLFLFQKNQSPEESEKHIDAICNLIASMPSEFRKRSYMDDLSRLSEVDESIIIDKVKEALKKHPDEPKPIKPGIYGVEELKESFNSDDEVFITTNYDEFLDEYGTSACAYIYGVPDSSSIQALRLVSQTLFANEKSFDFPCSDLKTGEPEPLQALCSLYKEGMDLTICDKEDKSKPFLQYYVSIYSSFLKDYTGDKTHYLNSVMDVISYASDSVRLVNADNFKNQLGLTVKIYEGLLKPFTERRKSSVAINAQRTDEDDEYDPEELPDYVEKNYAEMYHKFGYYPKLNKAGQPVCYMFKNEKSGHTQVGDFYIEPLLHIYSDDDEKNKRIYRINRRYYKTPLYVEWLSRVLLKKATLEEKLINLEAVNFSNGEEKHWTKIKEYMSRLYVTCTEIMTYGNQQVDGTSKREDQMFFAFANGIFHVVNGQPQFDYVNDLGAVKHNAKNYYLPAFSTIYTGSGQQNEKYETISQLVYHDIPIEKQCSFEKWTSLMNRVYRINDNGKWAILFAIMCAFRSNIYCIDRLFTAPFFMGPMSSGKTQIAISIRSLFISPKIPIFNLNIATDAAMSTLMSTFRDVPVVLDEYNNHDISDFKFQALKGIVYDGDGRQKRKATGTKELENDKVYTPVIICGQETPQRDDNALMSRIIVCEVPKPLHERTKEDIDLFNDLKDIENPDKVGLSNILFKILQLRPIVMEHFRSLKKDCYEQLKKEMNQTGEVDRLIKTCSLFLAMCKLIEDYTELQLPFTYDEFFKIAKDKIISQMEMISHTDKLATFFKAMDVMVDTKSIKDGRDFGISTPEKLTLKLPGGDRKELELLPGTHVLFLRVGSIYTQFARSSYNSEDSNQSTIEQNLRSHPAYIGMINSHKFVWEETEEVPREEKSKMDPAEMAKLGLQATIDNTMVKKIVKRQTNSSCIALNYDLFKEFYNIDLTRTISSEEPESNEPEDIPF